MFPWQDSRPCHTKVPAWSAFHLQPSFTHSHCTPLACLQLICSTSSRPCHYSCWEKSCTVCTHFAVVKIDRVKGMGQVQGTIRDFKLWTILVILIAQKETLYVLNKAAPISKCYSPEVTVISMWCRMTSEALERL